jgi:DNA-binding CsgD family transcriptional regulator
LSGTLGATTVARRIAARLRAHDVRLRAPVRAGRPTRGWGSLTPTELTVADLVGQGLTSPQIAGQLYLSPRTVQTHISHSLRKLDLRTRSELAAMVARHQR